MTDQPAPAKSNRRRLLLIGGLVLLVLAVIGYFMRPRLDPRFFGKWRARPGEMFEAEWTFKDDGTLVVRSYAVPPGREESVASCRWFVFRGRFYKTDSTGVRQTVSASANRVWMILNDQAAAPKVVIEQVTPDSIVLRPTYPGPKDDAQLIRLTRIVE